ncbi:MAG: ATP-binding protein [Bacteroidota bacterium]
MESSDEKRLKSLIAQGEHQQQDFKFEISDTRKIARTFSAFSNTDGGRLLVGVKDNGRITGIRSDEEYYMVESAAALYCKPEVHFETRNFSVEGKVVLQVHIPRATKRPVFAKDEENRWMAYVRVGDENSLANIIQLQIWKEEHKAMGRLLEFTRKEQILLNTIERNPGTSLSQLQKDTGFRRDELVPLMTKLVRFDVVEMTYSGGAGGFSLRERPGE